MLYGLHAILCDLVTVCRLFLFYLLYWIFLPIFVLINVFISSRSFYYSLLQADGIEMCKVITLVLQVLT